MFPLTRPHRQVLATLALLLLSVAPTVYVAATAWRIGGLGHLRGVELELGHRLGLLVSLDGVSYPRPGEVVYRGVVVRQEEPRRRGLTEVARARRVILRRGDGEVVLETDGLRLRGESPRLAMAQVGTMLQRPVGGSIDRVSLTAPTCELDLGPGSLRFLLREVAGVFQADRHAPSVRVSYRMASEGANTRCELLLSRDRKTEPVRTTLAFKTMEGLPLPSRVLDVFFESADWLGPASRVEGGLTLTQVGAGEWDAEFQGDLHDVDLATLVGRRFPSQRLTGLAHLAIHSARWGDRPGQGLGWIEARGELTAGRGAMGHNLLQSLGSEMSFRLPRGPSAEAHGESDIDFRALGFTFEMCRDGEIRLGGALGNRFAPDVVLAGQDLPLAYAPRGAANVRGLIKTLVPTNAADPVMVPLTDQSRVLLCFPAPPRIAAKGFDGN